MSDYYNLLWLDASLIQQASLLDYYNLLWLDASLIQQASLLGHGYALLHYLY